MCPYDDMERLTFLLSFLLYLFGDVRFRIFLSSLIWLSYQEGVTNVMLFWTYPFNVLYALAG